jgi:putative spermidine/putrescine transport system substrate-binding protein
MKKTTSDQRSYDSNQSRRKFLQLLGVSSVGAGSLLLASGCKTFFRNGQSTPELKIYGSGAITLENWDRAKNDLGVVIRYKDNGNDVGPVITQMTSGTAAEDFDLGCLQGGAEGELAQAGVILPWDLSKVPNFATLWSWARDIPYAKFDGAQYGLPVVINADSMIYLPDRVGTVDSYAAVFDPKLKGKTSMEDAWINSAIFTAIYLKQNSLAKIENPGDLKPDELGTVMEFLIKNKKEGQFRRLWNGWEDGLQLIKSQEVWVMTGWEPIVLAAQKAGVNAQYAVPKEGYEGWSNDLILHRGAKSRNLIDIAHGFANWQIGGYYGCAISELRGYVVPSDKTIEYSKAHPTEFDPGKIESTLTHVRDKFQKQGGQTFWQNVRPKEYKLYEQWWSKLRAA